MSTPKALTPAQYKPVPQLTLSNVMDCSHYILNKLPITTVLPT